MDRHAGLQGEINPMCSLELRSRFEELRLQNETHQKRIEEKYQTQYDNISHHINTLLDSLRDRSQEAFTSHSRHLSPAQPSHRYHPYSCSQTLTGPGIVCIFSIFIDLLSDLVEL